MIGLAMMLAAADVPMIVTVQGPPCAVALDGKSVLVADVKREAGRQRARRRGVVVKYGQASYECLGGVIYQLQRLKVERIRFDPPLDPQGKGWTVYAPLGG